LIQLVGLDFRRSWKRLAVAGTGITLAVAALVFLMSLALGLRTTLLEDVLPLDRLEVAAKSKNLNLMIVRLGLGPDTISEETVEELSAIPGVRAVYPKMKLTVPAVASGGTSLLGSGIQSDVVADGIASGLVDDEIGPAFVFDGLETDQTCASDRDCGDEAYCSGRGFDRQGTCRKYVPVLVSNHLVELYNGSFRRAYNLPQINPSAVIGFKFDMSFGASTVRPTGAVPIRERMRLVGFSDRAMTLGVTLPLEFVRRMNTRFGSESAAGAYHSAILELESPRAAPEVLEGVQAMDLAVSDRGAQRADDLMFLLIAILSLVGGTILAVATVTVAHSFFVTVWSRRREIGVLRVVGASRGDLRLFFLFEAAVVGGVAGGIGVVAAGLVATVVDRLSVRWTPDFPFKPDSFFQHDPWLLASGIGVAVVACVLGALIPVWRATAKDPADALTDY